MPENEAAKALKKEIQAKIARRGKLKYEVMELDIEIRKLNEGYKILTGESLLSEKRRGRPVLDYVEDLLRKYKKLHISEIKSLLESEFQIFSPSQSIASGLIRFHNQGKRFERQGKNTFVLRDSRDETK